MSKPRTGDGFSGGQKPSWRDLFMRRSTQDNQGLTSDIQPTNTAKLRRAAGGTDNAETVRKSRWFG